MLKDTGTFNSYMNMDVVKAAFPADMKFLLGVEEKVEKTGQRYYPLYAIKMVPGSEKAKLEGEGVEESGQSYDDKGRPSIKMQMTAIGSKTWARMTGDNVNKPIAIALDDIVYSAPNVNGAIEADNTLGYCARFLKMLYALPAEQYEVDPVVSDALDKLLILHADHEQNCSTSTVRIVGSSKASIYSSISAGINALWGPLHGGANQEVIVMLESIKNDGGDVEKWINKAKDKNSGFRLMGFGHRVYKNFDPRAKIIKKAADDVLAKLGVNDPILEIALKLEEVALRDPYFIERKLYPNVDFYSGIIYRALGIPVDMFTVMFAMGRLPGWIAQWKELRENKEPIGRPRQIYTGQNLRPYVELKKR